MCRLVSASDCACVCLRLACPQTPPALAQHARSTHSQCSLFVNYLMALLLKPAGRQKPVGGVGWGGGALHMTAGVWEGASALCQNTARVFHIIGSCIALVKKCPLETEACFFRSGCRGPSKNKCPTFRNPPAELSVHGAGRQAI